MRLCFPARSAGAKVTWQGSHYVCTAPDGVACVWDPGTYPAYWRAVWALAQSMLLLDLKTGEVYER